MVSLLLYKPMSGIHLGMIIRSAYILGAEKLYIYDSENILDSKKEEIYYHSTGLSESNKDSFEIIKKDILKFLEDYPGRIIITEIESKDAKSINKFQFEKNDLIVIGNERLGIPKEVIKSSKDSIVIPMLCKNYALHKNGERGEVAENWGKYPNLNIVAVAEISLFKAMESMGKYNSFDIRKLGEEN